MLVFFQTDENNFDLTQITTFTNVSFQDISVNRELSVVPGQANVTMTDLVYVDFVK